MRILVTGAAGLLGSATVAEAGSRGHDVHGLDRKSLDVTDRALVERTVARLAPDAVVQCAAYTAVDRAESEPDLARTINRDGTRNVARAAARHGATFVYVSTDYVFDGAKAAPYRPDDEANPLSVYGRTKLEGEQTAREASSWIVARTSWLYGGTKGFVAAILARAEKGEALRIVEDERGRPTWAPNAALTLVELLERGARGIWHVADGGDCTRIELAREAVRLAGLDVEITPVTAAAFGAPAARPSYSSLDLEATETLLGRRMQDWRQALRAYVGTRGAAAARHA